MWHIYTVEYYSVMKRNQTELFVVRWMDLEIIILSKSDKERQISYDIAYMWNLKKKKKDTNERIYKTETDSQTSKTNLWLPKQKLRLWD